MDITSTHSNAFCVYKLHLPFLLIQEKTLTCLYALHAIPINTRRMSTVPIRFKYNSHQHNNNVNRAYTLYSQFPSTQGERQPCLYALLTIPMNTFKYGVSTKASWTHPTIIWQHIHAYCWSNDWKIPKSYLNQQKYTHKISDTMSLPFYMYKYLTPCRCLYHHLLSSLRKKIKVKSDERV